MVRFTRFKEEMSKVTLFAAIAVGAISLQARSAAANMDAVFTPFIIGGTEVSVQDPIAATTVALLGDSEEGQFLCSGSILADDLIVTAGHCLGEDGKSSISILFSTHMQGAGNGVRTTGGMRPDSYVGDPNTSGNMYDIAIVHFTGGLPQGYHAAQLLTDSNSLKDGMQVTLAGYGVSDANADSFANSGAGILRKVDVKIKKAHMPSSELEVDQTHGKGSCNGDSGGPAFVNQGGASMLFGVTSRGDSTCARDGIYTNILTHASWIKTAAAALRNSNF